MTINLASTLGFLPSTGSSANPRNTKAIFWSFSSLWRNPKDTLQARLLSLKSLESQRGQTAVGALAQQTSFASPGLLRTVELPFGALSFQRSRAIRMTRSDNTGGTDILFMVGRDRRATTVYEYSFRMTSGEIDQRLLAETGADRRLEYLGAQKSETYARLLAIKNILHMPSEPMILDDGRRNHFIIQLHSVTDIQPIRIVGVFGPEGIRESYDGKKPKSVDFEFNFIALRQEPDHEEDLVQLVSSIRPPDGA